ncbi:uncharacterized protein LOC128324680 [Hemicordylus capensis]|uniref:uncharacterized protein LOC128324680 n=1 Tax=Hemicordylus capensis TaxID=884348 RepID=UPI0023033528|nr:uncharacterized protein LOC128324680 [Hemicordylus capensis]
MLVPRSLPEPCITNDILGRELNEETSVPGSLPEPHVPTDIMEQELNEETSVPRSLPEPCIHTDILEGELNEATSVPGSLPASHGPAACLRSPGSGSLSSSASLEVGSIPPSTSTSSFLLHPSSPPPSSPHPLELELSNVKEILESLMDLQFHQLNDRQRHLRICQGCLQNLKALRGDLRRLQSRLTRVEATMGILVPPRELDVEEEKEEDKNQIVLHP